MIKPQLKEEIRKALAKQRRVGNRKLDQEKTFGQQIEDAVVEDLLTLFAQMALETIGQDTIQLRTNKDQQWLRIREDLRTEQRAKLDQINQNIEEWNK